MRCHPLSYGLGLSAIRATAAEVKRVLLRLLARLGGDHDLHYSHPAVVAGVGMVLVLAGWVRRCARLCVVHQDLRSCWAAPPEFPLAGVWRLPFPAII